ncbi:Pyruvate carboxylase subunit A [Candidatus Gugararchaeum adminiculabundum]|nr:Pyruvate carboxylase subunit A [Candidatus Gugararchaeum adminiculabundum]
MPKRGDIKKVLVIGSGPIVIGQAAEFDYSGSQACTSLREEGIHVVLVNSNPATIQTDIEIADTVYIEPLKPEFIERIIAKEKPDGVIGTMGGQTGLNLTVKLKELGILDKYNVQVLGTGVESIKAAEDRGKFIDVLKKIKEPYLPSKVCTTVEEALEFAKKHAYPLILRPGYTLGGTGGGTAHTEEELVYFMNLGLGLSPVGQVLVEKSVIGWAEIEYEVVRDGAGNCITICNMENIDPMGVHTGESVVVAPSQTITNDEYQMLRDASLKIIRELKIEGGCNVQFSLNQKTGQYSVIEVNPRLSRSSALASKATGYPIARVAAKIALGYRLDEIKNAVTKVTPAGFEPALDYVVTKIPRWPFDKMPEANRTLGTQMKSTGEVMAIGRTFEESLMKAIRSLEVRQPKIKPEDMEKHLTLPTDLRIPAIFEAMRAGWSVEKIHKLTKINEWFLEKMKKIVDMEGKLKRGRMDELLMRDAKRMGFSDKRIAEITDSDEFTVRKARKKMGIAPVYKMVDTCAAEFEASTPYYYSTYEVENEAKPDKVKKVVVIGSGPIRIGQGIEFDYCCCHASFALRDAGVQSIMINNNPETISTDFDASDKLYFEPLTFEDVLNVIENESPDGVIVQFGGQTSINLTEKLTEYGVKILGTQLKGIDIAEDRDLFRTLMKKLGIPQPENGTATNEKTALAAANKIGYPIVVRPSYVIAGRAMQIIYEDAELRKYIQEAVDVSEQRPVLIDKYVENAIECEIDAVRDTDGQIYIGGVMEHIERAGVHSGDASCSFPPLRLSDEIQKKLIEYTTMIAKELDNIGAINIQYVVQKDKILILEANPRASRTIPYLSKATGVPLAKLATNIMLGKKLKEYGLAGKVATADYYSIKSVVFPFLKLVGTDIVLGPEMKSTGESMGIDKDFGRAYYKALIGANMKIPMKGLVAITLKDVDKPAAVKMGKELVDLGFTIAATDGTAAGMKGVKVEVLKKVSEGTPNIVSKIAKKEIALVVNTPSKGKNVDTDGYKIRRACLENDIPCITTLEAAFGLIEALKKVNAKELTVQPVSAYWKKK